ncbi:hypothetical protein SAMN02787144_1009208 [Streptomyces atratus]|uniref:Uncharacterized protein n=1 Tax=Streptomyces atratus TaxID=1893 RepID=A0A1K2BWE3_STRAR|nr:hypothetical protein SAMN02787144_1009208 [Streptomyces atratus]
MAIARMDALDGDARGVVQHALGLEARPLTGEPGIDDHLDPPPRPPCRHGPLQPEPAGGPGLPPLGAGTERLERLPEDLCHGNGFAGDVPDGERERGPVRVLGGADELVKGPFEAVLDQGAVVVHHGSSESAPTGCPWLHFPGGRPGTPAGGTRG